MTDYPKMIDNGAGERLTFLAVGSDERGEYLDVKNSVSPGAGPPMHVPSLPGGVAHRRERHDRLAAAGRR